jgi:hypothetical protein
LRLAVNEQERFNATDIENYPDFDVLSNGIPYLLFAQNQLKLFNGNFTA